MYREENLTVDLKVKEYNALRLKQMDSTKLIVKLIDDSIPMDLTNLDVDIIFTKPNQKIVMQSNNITVDNNRISIILLDDCLRMSGKAKIEIELKKNTEIVSSFFIPIFIEPTSKENIQSDNTPNYIETLEDAIVLEKERQKAETLRKNAETTRIKNEESRNSAEEDRESAEAERITKETTRESSEETRSNNETARQEAEIQRTNNETNRLSAESARVEAESQRVEEFEKIKKDISLVNPNDVSVKVITTEPIEENVDYTIPVSYKVGNNSLEIFYRGTKLAEGIEYIEVGEEGTLSNVIQFYDWGQDVPAESKIEFIVRGAKREISEDVKAEMELIRQENALLKSQIPQGSAEGEYITLKDSSNLPFDKFEIEGNSEQATRDGRNKLNASNPDFSNQATASMTDNILTVSSTDKNTSPCVGYIYNVAEGDIVRINSIILDSNGRIVIQEYKNSSWATVASQMRGYIDGVTVSQIQYNVPSNIVKIRILIYANYSIPTTDSSSRYKNTIITINNEDMNYEPYGIMPSTKFPSTIRNCGDDVNLFNKDNLSIILQGTGTNVEAIETGLKIKKSANVAADKVCYIVTKILDLKNYKSGENITIKTLVSGTAKNIIQIGTCNYSGNVRNSIKYKNNVTNNTYVSLTIQVPEEITDDNRYLALWLYANPINVGIEEYVDYAELKIQIGSEIKNYSPYNCGTINTKKCNKNLTSTDIIKSLNKPVFTNVGKNSFTIDVTKGIVSGLNLVDMLFGELDGSKQYTLSYHLKQNNDTFNPGLVFYYTDGTQTRPPINSNSEIDVAISSIVGKTIERISLIWSTASANSLAEFSNIQLEAGITATPYVEHQGQTHTIYTQKPFRKVDTTRDTFINLGKWNERHYIKRSILDGTENWALGGKQFDKCMVFYNLLNIGHFRGKKLSNQFIFNEDAYINGEDVECITNNTLTGFDMIIIQIKKERLASLDVAGIKAFLAERYSNNNPVYVDYELPTPEDIECTKEQINQLNELINSGTYKNVTNIHSLDEIKPSFKVKYRKDLETLLGGVANE